MWDIIISSSLRLKVWIWYRCQNRRKKYYQHNGEQLGCYKKVYIKTHRLSKKKDIYGCSFAANLSWKKKFFLKKHLCFFTKYTLFAEKNIFIGKKKVLYWKCFLLEKNFLTEKNIYENVNDKM